jgi:hypothetical protein
MGRTRVEEGKREREHASKSERAAAGQTIHISEITSRRAPAASVVNMALVGSAKRFGPAGATAVLALVVTLAAGIFYASQRWLPAAGQVTTATPVSDTAAALRQSASVRKTERVRPADNAQGSTAKATNSPVDNNKDRSVEKRSGPQLATSQLERKAAVVSKSPTVSRGEDLRRSPARNHLQRVGAPSIRFPKPELRDNAPTPSPESRVRNYSSSTRAPRSVSPQFFRTTDGTTIVKFSNGSTTLVPGKWSSGKWHPLSGFAAVRAVSLWLTVDALFLSEATPQS